MLGLQNVHIIFRAHPHEESGKVHYTVWAKYLQTPTHFSVLEDHTPEHSFSDLASATPEDRERVLARFGTSMYFKAVTAQDLQEGRHPELIAEETEEGVAAPTSQFEYYRVGMEHPQVLAFHGGNAFLDGFPLTPEELQTIHSNVVAGKATLTYPQAADAASAPVDTTESSPAENDGLTEQQDDGKSPVDVTQASLVKIEPELENALGGVREAIKAGHVHPDVLKTLTGHLFKDTMVPTMGNKVSYEDFLTRPKPGIHIRLDGRQFGRINKVAGFETGNAAIKSMFTAVRSALDESVGRKLAKSWRVGGDEGHIYVPTVEHAAAFHRALQRHMDKLPLVAGQKLAFDMGVGTSPETAEQGLIKAKTHSKSLNYQPHELKTHAYVNVPGMEGHLPMAGQTPPAIPAATPTEPKPANPPAVP